MKKRNKEIKWLSQPEKKDYAAAESFLRLLYKPLKVKRWIRELKQAEITEFQAKDILRASGTLMSEIQAFDWTKQQKQIAEGEPLSPILLVRQDDGGHLIVADGFHRMCALFVNDEQIKVPCQIV